MEQEQNKLTCIKCEKRFSNLSNLKKHVKGLHPGEYSYMESLQIRKIKEEKQLPYCDFCNKTFSNSFNLKRHLKRFLTEDSIGSKCLEVQRKEKAKKLCDLCKKEFRNSSNLRQHMKILHGKQIKCSNFSNNFLYNLSRTQLALKKDKCALCCYFSDKKTLLIHYRETHNIAVEEKKCTFASVEDFYSWKVKHENETNSKFIKVYNTLRGGHIYTGFRCHRSGSFSSRSKGIRHLKIQGSFKINGFCPAYIKLKKNSLGEYDVHVGQTHVGHQLEIRHLNLTNLERESLATKIALKIPFDDILDEERNSICDSNLKRIHLLTKKDLYNIEASFNLCSSSVRHSNDVISVESWIREMQEKGDAILFYKPQGSILDNWNQLKEDDFVLIIMTAAQSEMLKKYGSDCICFDGTHGISGYDFQLVTLLVVDDIRQGFPCAFLISNRTDKNVINIFLQQVKDKIGSALRPNVFMSDMDNAFINAWLEIMSPPKLRLFCTWHVDQAWRKHLKTKVKTREKQLAVYKLLRTLLEETDEKAFKIMLPKVYGCFMQDQDTTDFAEYFRNYYMTNTNSWAYCHRLGAGLNTNMHLERMHRTLKYTYLKGQKVKRLDKGINAIMRLVRDKCIDRLIVLNKGKLAKKIQIIRSRHTTSLKMDFNLITSTDSAWNVLSKDISELYVVQKSKENCDCQLRCVQCQACLHQYICSCIDSSIRYNMCKHIHLVCRHPENQIASTSTADPIDSIIEDTQSSSSMQEQEAHLTELSSTTTTTSESLDTIRRRLTDGITQLLQLVEVVGPEELLAIEKCIAPIKPTLEAIKSSKKLIIQAQNLVQNKIIPHNKKITHQRRLISTKKKTMGRKKSSLRKPDTRESNELALSFIV